MYTKWAFVRYFMEQLVRFRAHCRRAVLQYRAIHQLKSSLPPGHITIQMDFAENWQTASPIQSAYYGRCQITVHPAVAHFLKDGKLAHTSLAVVSDVRQHSAPTVYAIIRKTIATLQATIGMDIRHIHYISDSPSSQYRNVSIFSLIARHSTIFGIEASWIYLEAGHGKGPCDGIGAVSKRIADDQSKSLQDQVDPEKMQGPITNATEYVHWVNKRSSVVHVEVTRAEVEDVKASGDLRSRYTVPGTMQVHHVVSPIPGYICTRPTACYNTCCMSQTGEPLLTCKGWNAHLLDAELSNNTQVSRSLRTMVNHLRVRGQPRTTLSQRRKGTCHSHRQGSRLSRKPITWRRKRNQAVKRPTTQTESDSDDDVPLTDLLPLTFLASHKTPRKETDSEWEDDIPILTLLAKRRKVESSTDSEDDRPLIDCI